MKSLRSPTFALLALACLGASAATQTATITRVEERQVLNTAAYGSTVDALRDVRQTSREVHLSGLPTERVYVIRATTAEGKRIELVAKSGPAPRSGDSVQFDPRTREVVR